MYEHIVQESIFSDLFRFHSVTDIFWDDPFPRDDLKDLFDSSAWILKIETYFWYG